MDNFTSKLDRQKSSPQLSLSYNLDYDESSVWELPEITDFHKDLPFYVQEIGMTIAYEHYYVKVLTHICFVILQTEPLFSGTIPQNHFYLLIPFS